MRHYPLRQMLDVTGEAAGVFARQDLLDALSRPCRFQLVRHGAGGQVLAVRELGLAEARVVLRHAYGELVQFGALSVHAPVDAQSGAVLAPVMFLRIDAPRVHGRELLQLLRDRGVEAQDVDFQRGRVVLRAESPLARLLGVERAVGECTDGAAHVMCWLLRYAPGATARAPAALAA